MSARHDTKQPRKHACANAVWSAKPDSTRKLQTCDQEMLVAIDFLEALVDMLQMHARPRGHALLSGGGLPHDCVRSGAFCGPVAAVRIEVCSLRVVIS